MPVLVAKTDAGDPRAWIVPANSDSSVTVEAELLPSKAGGAHCNSRLNCS